MLVVTYLSAQTMMLRNYGVKDYGGGTQNWCIGSTANKWIVVANNSGLLIYDSRQWSKYPLPNYTTVRSVLYDDETRMLWAGGTNEFGYFEHNACHDIFYKSASDRLPLKQRQFGEIWNIVRHGGSLVFQCKDRLIVMGRDSSLHTIEARMDIDCSAVIDGRLLVAGREGLFEVEKGKCKKLPNTEALEGKDIRQMLPFGKRRMIVCTSNDGLYTYDGKATTELLPELTPFLKRNQLFCAALHDDVLAMGTVRKGLVMHNLKTGENAYANTDTGLADNTILSMCFDASGNIWLGLDYGVAYVMPSFPAKRLLGTNCHIGTGYASLVAGDNLYIGTNQGLFAISYPLGQGPTPPVPADVAGLSGQVWGLWNVGGRILCAANEGAFVIDGLKATRIEGPVGTWCFTNLNHHPQYVLGCDYKGLFVLHKADMTFAWRLKGFDENSGSMTEADDGSIWISHWQKGIYRLTLSDDCRRVEKTERFGKGNGLVMDNDNLVCKVGRQVYVSSVDGFFRYNAMSRRLEHDATMNGIFNTYGVPLRILETPEHDIWAYKPGYLAIAHPRKEGGFDIDYMSYNGILHELQMGLGHSGHLPDRQQTIFCSLGGFILADNHASCPQNTTKLMVDKISSINNGDSLLYVCHAPADDITYAIDHDNNSLRLRFIMPDYVNPGEIEYSCLLEGYDSEWSNWQTTNTKDYTRLPKGKYTFRVKARNKMSGQEQQTAITMEIKPALYETWWAYIVYILLLAAAGKAVMKAVTRRQERKIKLMEMRQAAKIRRQQAEYELEKQKLKNEQLETELKHRQSEIGDSTMNLMRKNDMLHSLDIKLSELSESVRREDAKAKITQSIRDIRHEVQANINDDEGWEKFKENFDLVYDNFMKRLTAQFPDLKKNDLKLCAYLRMGLSSKEIASLLNMSVRSIETARYRLRKKLGIGQGDNLSEFIQSLEQADEG